MTDDRLARPIPVRPGFQLYPWGDSHFIPDLFSIPNPDRTPYAEAWLGAHPLRPATALLDGVEVPLDRLLARSGAELLGADALSRFGGLPFLLKVLAAARPLSIQVHPTRAQAEEGFRREEAAGIPRDAPERTYRDPHHKPELLVALTEFHVLCGFRPLDEISDLLEGMPELQTGLPAFEPSPAGLRRYVESYLALPPERVARMLRPVMDRLGQKEKEAPLEREDPAGWALAAHREFSREGRPDPGLLFVLLLNLVRLEPGDGIFLPAGVPHSYLKGVGVEVMASSDNVVRCGLTTKHVDTTELLRIVRFQEGGTARLVPESTGPGEAIYRTSAEEFELARIQLSPGAEGAASVARGPELWLAVDGDFHRRAEVRWDGGAHRLRRGTAWLVPHGLRYSLAAQGPVTMFRARVPPSAAGLTGGVGAPSRRESS